MRHRVGERMSLKTQVSALILGKEGAVGVWPNALWDRGHKIGNMGEKKDDPLMGNKESEE